jgi:hypothetical protein
MKSNKKAIIKDTAYNSFLIFVLVTIVGMFSNVIILAFGYMISLPISKNGYNDTNTQLLWFTLAAISLIVCILSVCVFAMLVGASATQLRISYGLDHSINVTSMVISVLSGNLLHFISCVLLSWSSLAHLIIAGPVQYIARFIGKGEMSIFHDVAFDFSREIVISSIIIYSFCITAASFAGYILGHRKKLKDEQKRAEEEALMQKSTLGTWSIEDNKKAFLPNDALKIDDKPKVIRCKLDPKQKLPFVHSTEIV